MGDGDAVGAPALLGGVEPGLDLGLQGVEAEVEVLGLAALRGGTVELAAGVDQPAGGLGLLVPLGVEVGLEGVEEVAAGVALGNELAAGASG